MSAVHLSNELTAFIYPRNWKKNIYYIYIYIYKYIHLKNKVYLRLKQVWFYTSKVTRGKETNAIPATTLSQCLSTTLISWHLTTHHAKIVGMFGPPLGPSPHDLSTILMSQQMLTLNFTRTAQISNASARYSSQGLQHAVPATLPPVLQSNGSKLMTLQDWGRSALQQTATITLGELKIAGWKAWGGKRTESVS